MSYPNSAPMNFSTHNINLWILSPSDRLRFESIFSSLLPIEGKITGEKARACFMRYNLPVETLGHIWTLSDVDVDGKLDCDEFCIAMHLIETRLKGIEIPASLPATLLTPAKLAQAENVWCLGSGDKLKYKQMFNTHDSSRNGYLSGTQAQSIFSQSLLPKPILAQVWSLSDLDKDGRLNSEEFAIAMHLLHLAKTGLRIPERLPTCLLPSHRGLNVQHTNVSPSSSIEDIKKSNLERGQLELQRRRQLVEEQLRSEREAQKQREKEAEAARFVKLEQQRMKREKMRLAEMELKKKRDLDIQRRVEEERLLELKKRELDYENQRIDGIRLELTRQREEFLEQIDQFCITQQRLDESLRKLDTQKFTLQKELEKHQSAYNENEEKTKTMRQTYLDWNAIISPIQAEIQESQYKLGSLREEKAKLASQWAILQQLSATARSSNAESVRNIVGKIGEITAKIPSLSAELDRQTKLLSEKRSELDGHNEQLRVSRQQLIHVKRILDERRRETEKAEEERLAQEIQVQERLKYDRQVEAAKTRRLEAQKRAAQSLNRPSTTLSSNTPHTSGASSHPPLPPPPPSFDSSASKTTTLAGNPAPASLPLNPGADFAQDYLDEHGAPIKVIALYDYSSCKEDDLSFREDDVITLLRPSQDGWCLGRIDSSIGWFPDNYVDPFVEGEASDVAPEAFQPSHASEPTLVGSHGDHSCTPGRNYVAIFSYSATNQDEISFHEGDLIEVVETSEDGWWKGISGSSVGYFPSSYVQLQQDASHADAVETNLFLRALYDYVASEQDGLSFSMGDVIQVVSKSESGWWKGVLNGHEGWFPSNYVDLDSDSEEGNPALSPSSLAAAAISSASIEEAAQEEQGEVFEEAFDELSSVEVATTACVLHDYEAMNEGDISLKEGDVVRILRKVNDGWWQGELCGKIGMFPANYVEEMTAGESGLVEAKDALSSSQRAIVVLGHEPSSDSELQLLVGEYVEVVDKSDQDWWQGLKTDSRGNSCHGWFPSSCVQLIADPASSRRSTNPFEETTAASVNGVQMKAIYDYQGSTEDELSFLEGDIILVVDRTEGGWWEGYCSGKHGWFPSAYVSEYEETKNPHLDTDAKEKSRPPSNQDFSHKTNWIDTVDPKVVDILGDQEKKRQQAIFELIDTEESYVEDLKLIENKFMIPIESDKILTADQMKIVFINWKKLIEVNSSFLHQLKHRQASSQTGIVNIGDLLYAQMPKFMPYIQFCSGQIDSCVFIQSQKLNPFSQFISKSLDDPLIRQLPLSSFLLKPMQRITKYPLLIKKILHSTSRNHSDLEDIKKALVASENLVMQVNEGVRRTEIDHRLQQLEKLVLGLPSSLKLTAPTKHLGPREILCEGKVMKPKSSKELYLIVFNDLLLITKYTASFPKGKDVWDLTKIVMPKMFYQLLKPPISMNQVIARSPQTPTKGQQSMNSSERENLFEICHVGKIYSFVAPSSRNKMDWIEKINKGAESYFQMEHKLLSTTQHEDGVQHLGNSHFESLGTVEIIILEGTKLLKSGNCSSFCLVKYDNVTFRSKLKKDSNNPKWNFECILVVRNPNDQILIQIFNQMQFVKDTLLGELLLNMNQFLQIGSESFTHRYPLQNSASSEAEITLCVTSNLG